MNKRLHNDIAQTPANTIRFRSRYIARDLGFQPGFLIRFDPKAPGTPSLELRRITETGETRITERAEPGDILCVAELEKTPTRKIREWIENGSEEVPNGFKDFADNAFSELAVAVRKTLQLIQWRTGHRSVPNPIRWSPLFEWSADGQTWLQISVPIGHLPMIFRFGADKTFSDEVVDSLKVMWKISDQEPLAHNLFQEAWSQVHTNPRSSLVIGIAAAETGMKRLISELVPASAWLILNIQSPPLVQILEGYLPLLPIRVRFDKKTPPPLPQSLLDIVKKGVNLRNEIVHGKEVDLKKESLIEILNTISDLLYIFDLYAGHNWAQTRIRGDTLRSWLKVLIFDSFPFTVYS